MRWDKTSVALINCQDRSDNVHFQKSVCQIIARTLRKELLWQNYLTFLKLLTHSRPKNEDSCSLSYAPRRHEQRILGRGKPRAAAAAAWTSNKQPSNQQGSATTVCRYTNLPHFQSSESLWQRDCKPSGFPLTMPHLPIMALLGIAHSYRKISRCLGDTLPQERRDRWLL